MSSISDTFTKLMRLSLKVHALIHGERTVSELEALADDCAKFRSAMTVLRHTLSFNYNDYTIKECGESFINRALRQPECPHFLSRQEGRRYFLSILNEKPFNVGWDGIRADATSYLTSLNDHLYNLKGVCGGKDGVDDGVRGVDAPQTVDLIER